MLPIYTSEWKLDGVSTEFIYLFSFISTSSIYTILCIINPVTNPLITPTDQSLNFAFY